MWYTIYSCRKFLKQRLEINAIDASTYPSPQRRCGEEGPNTRREKISSVLLYPNNNNKYRRRKKKKKKEEEERRRRRKDEGRRRKKKYIYSLYIL